MFIACGADASWGHPAKRDTLYRGNLSHLQSLLTNSGKKQALSICDFRSVICDLLFSEIAPALYPVEAPPVGALAPLPCTACNATDLREVKLSGEIWDQL